VASRSLDLKKNFFKFGWGVLGQWDHDKDMFFG